VVNTAVAFTLWNRSLRADSPSINVINNCMLIQAVLAWMFSAEYHTAPRCRIGLAALGTVLVQLRFRLKGGG
jgi:hypothetical protein